jgi:hypothetical protein
MNDIDHEALSDQPSPHRLSQALLILDNQYPHRGLP